MSAASRDPAAGDEASAMVELRLLVRSEEEANAPESAMGGAVGREWERERARVMEDGERRDWGAKVG